MDPRGYSEPGRLASPISDQPDFALIYAFLGSLFDPSCASLDHMDVLEQMKDIDRQTATLLMRNVISNLQNPEAWQEHVRLLQKAALEDSQELETENREASMPCQPHAKQFDHSPHLGSQPSRPSLTARASSVPITPS